MELNGKDGDVSGSLALRLRVLRAERALTIEQAAARAGVMPETVSDAERGRRHPYLPTLKKLAKAYDVPVEELLGAEEGGGSEREPVLLSKAKAPDPGPSEAAEAPRGGEEEVTESVITIPIDAQNDVINAFRQGKITKREASRALADLVVEHDSVGEAVESILDDAELEREAAEA